MRDLFAWRKSKNKMQISVIGSGYVGLVAATCLSELGHNVVCVDCDSEKIAALNAGETLIHEDYLQELLSRHRGTRLSFSTSVKDATADSLVIFIAVGTPLSDNGAADLSYVESVTKAIAQCANGIQRVMVLKGRNRGEFDVVSNPEFLREGSAVTDFLYPDRIVVGASTERAAGIMREMYTSIIDGSYTQQPSAVPKPERARISPIYIETSPQSAELIKHASNAFLALKISFINAVANVCESVGADIEEVSKGLGSDGRIGPDFLRAGIGYGGSCFPKDVAAFRAVAREFGYDFPLLDEVHRINEQQRPRFIAKVRTALRTLKGKRLAVLGLAFKDGTDDVRESPAIQVIKSLLQEGCKITAFDPAAMDRAKQVLGDKITCAKDPYAAADGADALLILTEWKEFSSLDLARMKRLLRNPTVLDGRNLYDPAVMKEAGLNYYSIGRAPCELSHAAVLKKSHTAK